MTLFQQITKQKEKKERKNKSNFQVKFIIWSCFIQTLVSSYQKTRQEKAHWKKHVFISGRETKTLRLENG
jgi:hypothetical protein